MSTQFDGEIPFSLSSSQLPFRLLELPKELVTLLSSKSPPTLYFKSSDISLGSSEAVVCTADRAYQLRQVQTSNTVYVTQQSQPTAIPGGPIPPLGISTISLCGSTLELSAATTESAVPLLEAVLPFYTSDDTISSTKSRRTKTQIVSDVPLSGAECERAWTDLLAFQSLEHAGCFRPDTSILVKAWSHIHLSAVEKSIELTARLSPTDIKDLVNGAGEWPAEIAEAIFKYLLSADQQAVVSGMTIAEVDPTIELFLDRRKTVQWVGRILLEDLSHRRRTLSPSGFVDSWRDQLPEAWRADAALGVLEGNYRSLPGGEIQWLPKAETASVATAEKAVPAANTSSKRNWHEKLKQSRNR